MEIDTEELKEHAPLISYIKRFYPMIQLEKENNNIAFMRCIAHEEKTASMALYANGTCHCFGCGYHGDLIAIVQALEGISFTEACKMIGDNVGYDIVLEEPNLLHEQYKDMMDNHCRRYWSNLQKSPKALKYLFDRGITSESINLFRLGLSDPEEFKYRNLGNISNRISFPILEHKRIKPKCVGIAYRTITNENPKYINDVNQDGRQGQDPNLEGVFIKGNLLYGFYLACSEITKLNYAILVEGYMDVISMHQANIKNTVCIMGTSITQGHIKELKKRTSNLLLLLDGDEAGRRNMLKQIPALYMAGFNVAICILPNSMDPADLCLSLNFNQEEIQRTIKSLSKQAIDIVISDAVESYEAIVSIERTKSLRRAIPAINAIQDEAIREMYKKKLFKKLDIE